MALRSILFLGTIILSNLALGQSSITGLVQEMDGTAIPFANVLVLENQDSALVKGVVSDVQGEFKVPKINPGNYLVSFSSVGYQGLTKPITITNLTNDLGPVLLEKDVRQLEEVVVEAQKPLFEQQIDRLVVNIESSITMSGISALEVLERSPGIIINRQNYTLSMSGKQGVVVMINGKISRMPINAVLQMLEGMNSNNIEKIELITTPPSKYDAEGDAGMINIVLKKSADEGTNGSFSLTAGYGDDPKAGASGNFNSRKKKINLFGNYSYLFNRNPSIFANDRVVAGDSGVITTMSSSFRDADLAMHNGQFGVDYQVSPKTSIGGGFEGYLRNWEMDAFNESMITAPDSTEILQIPNDELNKWWHLGGNFNLNHKFSESQSVNLDFDYLYYENDNPTNYSNLLFDENGNLISSEEVRVRKSTPITIWVGALDYSREISERFKFETGIKGTLQSFNNDVSVESLQQGQWVADSVLTGNFDLKENIGAAYASFALNLGPKTDLNAGLRYEYTDTDLTQVGVGPVLARKFGELFPTIFISHKLAEENVIQFSYGRRITRPTFRDMAPFVIFLDPFTFFKGNPAVQAAITNSVKAEYRYKNYMVSFQYSHDEGAIARFQPEVDPETNQQFFVAENIKSIDNYTILVTIPFEIGSWFETQNNATANWTSLEADHLEEPIKLDLFGLRVNSTNTFKFPRNFSFEVQGFYQSPALWGLWKTESMGALNLGLQKKFNNDWGSLRLNVSDILRTMEWNWGADFPEQNVVTNGAYIFEQQVWRLIYSRNFGNKKLKQARKRTSGSTERQRAGVE